MDHLRAKKFHKYKPLVPVRHLYVVIAVFMAAKTALNIENNSATHIEDTVPSQNP